MRYNHLRSFSCWDCKQDFLVRKTKRNSARVYCSRSCAGHALGLRNKGRPGFWKGRALSEKTRMRISATRKERIRKGLIAINPIRPWSKVGTTSVSYEAWRQRKREDMKKINEKYVKNNPDYVPWNRGITKGMHPWADASSERMTTNNKRKFCSFRPNKPEKVLVSLIESAGLPYKYVGGGQFMIERFNPDFINCNGQKKIIEFNGEYWHSLPQNIDRDKKKMETYLQYGFRTLIIWEHELKDLACVLQKIREFDAL